MVRVTVFLLIAVVCQDLGVLVNGRIEYLPDTTDPYLEGTEATHICNPGFVLEGNEIRTCQNNSMFDGTPPTCVRELKSQVYATLPQEFAQIFLLHHTCRIYFTLWFS